jgi:AmmeMemoRadiSam system protein A/AmmeMemoRadiSam system protein B
MVGPSHHVWVDRVAVFGRGRWRTPLGSVAVDEELARLLVAGDSVFADAPSAHAAEHSLEVQLPWLQRVLGEFRTVPVMMSHPSYEQCERVGAGIAKACAGRRVVLLASSDLYHGEFDDSYERCGRSDSVTAGLMLRMDPRRLYDHVAAASRPDETAACGGFPIVVVMLAARALGADAATLLARTNSNDVTGSRGGYCVGYSAVAFTDTSATGGQSDELSLEEQQSLLGIARQTVEQYVRTGKQPDVQPLTARLSEKRGVFVTLKERGELRGCIGYIESPLPLYLGVRDRAVQSATRDPRFPPVRPEELVDLDIEITVLSPIRSVAGPESVVVGVHGVVIEKDNLGAVFLPQVPVEQGWDRNTYLSELCRKAGLPRDAWKSRDARLYVFTGQVFGEPR